MATGQKQAQKQFSVLSLDMNFHHAIETSELLNYTYPQDFVYLYCIVYTYIHIRFQHNLLRTCGENKAFTGFSLIFVTLMWLSLSVSNSIIIIIIMNSTFMVIKTRI